jgi:hypothetical protein
MWRDYHIFLKFTISIFYVETKVLVMIQKNLLVLICMMTTIIAQGQKHVLPEPKDWGTETFPIPIEFAPNIPYTGEEEVRFSPGWGDTTSVQRWSYSFLWWIKADSKLDAVSLKKYLEEYYGGLVSRNIERRKIPARKLVPTVATITENKNASRPFTATVSMLDYMRQKPMKLNIDVSIQECAANGKRGIFFAVSPQPRTHAIWKDFENIWSGFRCGE